MEYLDYIETILDRKDILSSNFNQRFCSDWTHIYKFKPLAVAFPRNTEQVSNLVKASKKFNIPIVPMSGNTGLVGGTFAENSLIISLEKMNSIIKINKGSNLVSVEAGVILSDLHSELSKHNLSFPVTFGARGSAMIGGILSSNAGGSNVLKYGNSRDLCLGIEVVLPDGRILNMMSELHKDNSGLDLKNLLIGSEGTLGIITKAILKIFPTPKNFFTAMICLNENQDPLNILRKVENKLGKEVEAFEYMPAFYVKEFYRLFPKKVKLFDRYYDINILLEVASNSDVMNDEDNSGTSILKNHLEEILSSFLDENLLENVLIAQNDSQRKSMWEIREAAAEITVSRKPVVITDVSLPLDSVSNFINLVNKKLDHVEKQAPSTFVSHLGDGNVHYWVWPKNDDKLLHDNIVEIIEGIVYDLKGSFSAEHGIGIAKLNSMKRRKDNTAVDVMLAIKNALDPTNIMNPGKVFPKV